MSDKPLVNNEWIAMNSRAAPMAARTNNISLAGTIADTLDEMRRIYEAELERLRTQLADMTALNERNVNDALRAVNAEKGGLQLAHMSVIEWGKREQHIKKLEAELAECQKWEDVPSGSSMRCYCGCDSTLYIHDGAMSIEYGDGTLASIEYGDNWRIQRRKEGNDG